MRTLYVSSPDFFQIPTYFFSLFLLGCWLYGSASRAYPDGREHEPTALLALAMWRRVLASNAGIPEYILPVSFGVPHAMPIDIPAKIEYSELGLARRGSGSSPNHLKPQGKRRCSPVHVHTLYIRYVQSGCCDFTVQQHLDIPTLERFHFV